MHLRVKIKHGKCIQRALQHTRIMKSLVCLFSLSMALSRLSPRLELHVNTPPSYWAPVSYHIISCEKKNMIKATFFQWRIEQWCPFDLPSFSKPNLKDKEHGLVLRKMINMLNLYFNKPNSFVKKKKNFKPLNFFSTGNSLWEHTTESVARANKS